jgi:signal transduction histidine kinase
VVVAARYASAGPDGGIATITVDDDGPGITEDQMQAATGRGKRLDESKPGSGLGLSIVTDLVAMYKGTLVLSRAPIGGLRAEVNIPAG